MRGRQLSERETIEWVFREMRERCLDRVRAYGIEEWRVYILGRKVCFYHLINSLSIIWVFFIYYFGQIGLGLGLISFGPKFSNISY